MKLIIDIPEEVKHKVYAYGLSLCPSDKEQLIHAIMNGTPLPKGHGRLIDSNALKMRDISPEAWYSPMWGLEMQDIEDAPTIIEADTESEGME